MKQKNFCNILLKKRVELLAGFLLFVYFIQCIYIIPNTGMIGDEQFYPGVGKYVLTTGDIGSTGPFALRYHPILPYYINSLFLFFDKNPVWQEKPFSMVANADAYGLENLLFLTRLPIALTGILLGIFIFHWARRLYGGRSALLALMLFVFEPTILGNSTIATTDLVATTFMFIALYYLWCLCKNPNNYTVLIAGITLGLALLSKFTLLVLIPIAFLMIFYRMNISFRTTKIVLIYFLMAFFVVWAFYGFQFDSMMNVVHSKEKSTEFIGQIFHDEGTKSIVMQLMNTPIPAPTYLNAGLGYNIFHSAQGHISYLMGEISIHGWWYYYTIAYLIKTPIPILIFLAVFVIFLVIKKIKIEKKDGLILLLPIILTFVFLSFFVGFNIGIRHLMIIYPLVFVLLSKIMTINFRKCRKKIFNILVILILLWYVLEAIDIMPYNMSYFNEFIGGSRNGHLWLSDANVDIGQGINEITKYVDKNNLTDIYISTAIPDSLLKFYGNFTRAPCEPKVGVYAMSIEMIDMISRDCHSWLRERTPDTVLGYSVFIYNVTSI